MKLRSSSGAAALSCAVLAALSSEAAYGQLRAFGEAEGFGAYATGGRGATSVYHVTNWNDTGAGSFRDAVSQTKSTIVVFDVGGIINLASEVAVKSNITIAGQTAPGGGIMITGREVSFGSQSNIVARYLRFRPGDGSGTNDNGLNLYMASNLIVDHTSIEYAKYDNIDAVGVNNATVQNSIIADPIGQQFGAHTETVGGHFTWSNNLWANGHNRQPLSKINDQFKNNLVYNFEAAYTTHTSTAFSHDLVNNAFIWGPATDGNTFYQMTSNQSVYASGNVQDSDKDGNLDSGIVTPSGVITLTSPAMPTTVDLPTMSVSDAYAYVTAHAGASQVRDELDNLVVSQVQTLGKGTTGKGVGTTGPSGGLYGSAASNGLSNTGLGTIANVTRPSTFDTDRDGIDDAWEATHGLSSSNATDAFAYSPLGYQMVEVYLNELGDANASRTWTATGGASWATAGNWTGSATPGVYDHALVRGTASANGSVTASTAINAMTLSIGGGGPTPGERVTVNSTGNLRIYDTLTVGDQGNGFLDINGGTVTAYNVVLGNTVYAPSATIFTGTLTLNSGTLGVSQLVLGAGTPGAWNTGGMFNWNGGTLKAVGTLRMNVPVMLNINGGTFDTNGFDGTVSSVISELTVGDGNLTKKGLGKLTLTGNSIYTGVTKISAGTLAVATLTDGGVAGPLGAGSTAASRIVLDGGALAYTGAAADSTNRLMTLTANGGTLDGGASGGFAITSTGIFAASGTGNRSLTLLGTGTNNSFSADLADPTGGKTSLVMGGTGRWILNGAAAQRAYSGDTIINAGTLLGFVANTLPFGAGKGNLVVNTGGIFEMNGNALSINGLNGAGNVNQRTTSKSPTLTIGNGDASGTFTGTLTNAGGTALMNVVKTGAGTQTLAGINTYGGATTISAGTLALDGAGTLGTGQVSVGAGATLKLNPTLSKALKVASSFFIVGTPSAPNGKVDLTTEGMVIDYPTTVGTLLTDTTALVVAGRGTRNPVTGIHAFNALGITSSAAAANNLVAGFEQYSVGAINNADLTTFGQAAYTTFGGQTVDATSVLVRYTYNGDANLDGVLDAKDYALLNKGFAGTIPNVGWLSGDFTGDGLIDADDYAVLDYGYLKQGAAVGFGDPVTVPEPAGIATIGLLVAISARRKK